MNTRIKCDKQSEVESLNERPRDARSNLHLLARRKCGPTLASIISCIPIYSASSIYYYIYIFQPGGRDGTKLPYHPRSGASCKALLPAGVIADVAGTPRVSSRELPAPPRCHHEKCRHPGKGFVIFDSAGPP